jgi:hypothetical protein
LRLDTLSAPGREGRQRFPGCPRKRMVWIPMGKRLRVIGGLSEDSGRRDSEALLEAGRTRPAVQA